MELNPSNQPEHPDHIKNHKPRKDDFNLPPEPKEPTQQSLPILKSVIVKDCPFLKKKHEPGFLVSSLPPSERKAYMQHNQDQDHECWTRTDFHIDKIEVERKKEEKKRQDNDDKVISQATTISSLTTKTTEQADTIATLILHINSLTTRLDKLEKKQ